MIKAIIQKENIMDKVNSSNTKIKIKKPDFMKHNIRTQLSSFDKRSKSVMVIENSNNLKIKI